MLLKKHIQNLNCFRFLVDLLMVLFSWIVSFLFRFEIKLIALTRGDDSLFNYIRLSPLLVFCYFIIFVFLGGYQKNLTQEKIWEENFRILKLHVLSFLIFVTMAFFLFEHRYSRVAIIFFFIITPILISMGRSLVRKLNRLYLKRQRPLRKAIIIGNGPHIINIEEAIKHRQDWNLKIEGKFSFHEFSEIYKQIDNMDLSAIFVVPDANENRLINDIYSIMDKTLAEIFLFPYLGDKVFFAPTLVHIENATALVLNTSNMNSQSIFMKRVFDIIFSLCFLIIFSPIYFICAVLVKSSSKGPIFYKQERMGLDGKKFQCLKFRGMYINAEEDSGPVWAKSGDTRTTSVGRWLRKTSLDEIPQFINVLKGDMSIVGPRPERPFFVENFKQEIPGYLLRHKMKAGITGWAQINGWRGNTSLEKRIECDLWYIQNWSLWLDIKIVLLTPLKGFIHPNAY